MVEEKRKWKKGHEAVEVMEVVDHPEGGVAHELDGPETVYISKVANGSSIGHPLKRNRLQ